ncbi:tRNA1(Val) (adenine(37)-N6)-methyltransferase [Marinicauda sp. Alg238-R41]|uniref:tRNA1(Val) (adenine(37)-N6)-methyltransferase n=1 Tax=Marinicauda sp. Alg238-R41 TaxID=2993447 RepID=UPI0022E28BE3|nr:methyltransferase [Marinicauda sp. Alg238-R41]
MTPQEAVTRDGFLGGRLTLWQSAQGYRAGIDAALLAASLELDAGGRVVEFGCGPGAALLSAALRYPQASFTGLERDPEAAALAARNIEDNALSARVQVIETDALSYEPEEGGADAVFFNPPFFEDASSLRAPKENKRAAWMNDTTLADWVRAGASLLAPRGSLTLIHRADALDLALAACRVAHLGSIVVLPVHTHANRAAKRILVRAVKAGRAPLQLRPGFVLHDDGPGQYTELADRVLRGTSGLAMTR